MRTQSDTFQSHSISLTSILLRKKVLVFFSLHTSSLVCISWWLLTWGRVTWPRSKDWGCLCASGTILGARPLPFTGEDCEVSKSSFKVKMRRLRHELGLLCTNALQTAAGQEKIDAILPYSVPQSHTYP